MTHRPLFRNVLLGGVVLVAALAAAPSMVDVGALLRSTSPAEAAEPAAAPAMPVSVAVVASTSITPWNSFSGRLEAVDHVDVRSRVAGAIDKVHFKEGALVKAGDLLVSVDPRPYAAEVARAKANVAAAESRVAYARNELNRGKKLVESRTVSESDYDQRINTELGALADLEAARAVLQTAELNLAYTEIRAPISGRVGKIEVTAGNLIEAGASSPVLTRLVSLSPIYASFEADEDVVAKALSGLPVGPNARDSVGSIPVRMDAGGRTDIRGQLQLIDNTVDAASGTVRVRAAFENADGSLMPGQFARLSMGRAKNEDALLISERAVGTDQDKKFVFVVGADNKAEYRSVSLGERADGLRIVTSGLKPDERIVVNGLQRVQPGAEVAPEIVDMRAAEPADMQVSEATPTK